MMASHKSRVEPGDSGSVGNDDRVVPEFLMSMMRPESIIMILQISGNGLRYSDMLTTNRKQESINERKALRLGDQCERGD